MIWIWLNNCLAFAYWVGFWPRTVLITLLTAYSMKLYMVFKLLNFVVCFVHFLYLFISFCDFLIFFRLLSFHFLFLVGFCFHDHFFEGSILFKLFLLSHLVEVEAGWSWGWGWGRLNCTDAGNCTAGTLEHWAGSLVSGNSMIKISWHHCWK